MAVISCLTTCTRLPVSAPPLPSRHINGLHGYLLQWGWLLQPHFWSFSFSSFLFLLSNCCDKFTHWLLFLVLKNTLALLLILKLKRKKNVDVTRQPYVTLFFCPSDPCYFHCDWQSSLPPGWVLRGGGININNGRGGVNNNNN